MSNDGAIVGRQDGFDELTIVVVECIRNLMAFSNCSLPEAIRCATENIADMMGDQTRGKLEEGRRADFVVMNDEGEVLQTWIAGTKVWEKGE